MGTTPSSFFNRGVGQGAGTTPTSAPAAPAMTAQQAQQMLASGQGTPDQLAQANSIYYGSQNSGGGAYGQNQSVQSAAPPVNNTPAYTPQNNGFAGAGNMNQAQAQNLQQNWNNPAGWMNEAQGSNIYNLNSLGAQAQQGSTYNANNFNNYWNALTNGGTGYNAQVGSTPNASGLPMINGMTPDNPAYWQSTQAQQMGLTASMAPPQVQQALATGQSFSQLPGQSFQTGQGQTFNPNTGSFTAGNPNFLAGGGSPQGGPIQSGGGPQSVMAQPQPQQSQQPQMPTYTANPVQGPNPVGILPNSSAQFPSNSGPIQSPMGGFNSWGNPYEGNPYSYMTGQPNNWSQLFNSMPNNTLGMMNPLSNSGIGNLGGYLSLLQGLSRYPQIQTSPFGGNF